MDNQLKDFFFDEQDRGRLVFEDFPEYNELMEQCLSLFCLLYTSDAADE